MGVTTPGGYECAVSIDRRPSTGAWSAAFDPLYEATRGSDARVTGTYSHRLDAVVGLWAARRIAHSGHTE